MITERDITHNSKYRFSHIAIDVLEVEPESKMVVAFTATYLTTKLPGQVMSPGLMEINKTLWDQSSTKRPPGYLVLGAKEDLGMATSYFVSEEWLDTTPKEVKKAKREEWGIR